MKKHFLKLFALMLTINFSFAQQNKSTNVSAVDAENYSTNTSTFKSSNPSAVFSTTTTSCMSINLPAPATWSLVNYGNGTTIFAQNGFVNGPNTFGDLEKAMYYDVSASANSSITHVYVGFDHAYTTTPSKIVTLKIYDGTTTNVIGALLGSKTMTMGEIMADVAANQYSDFLFNTPIALPASKKFYASVEFTGLVWNTTTKDSLSIVSNTDGQSIPTPVWEKWSNSAWYNYANVSSWQLDISLMIHPFLVQSPVISNFTIASNTICAGQSASYNSAGSTTGGSVYWDFGSSPTATSTALTPSNLFPSIGTYTTYLLVYDACGSYAVSSKTLLVNALPTVGANITSTNVCSGTNITLSGTGASSYSWSGGITNNVPFSALSSINYTVTGTATNGCTNTAVSSVVVTPNPVVTASTTAASVCAGGNITLTGSGATSYVWSGGVTNAVPFAPSASGSYTVTGTTGACSGTAAISIAVNPNPTVTANTTTSTVCPGSNITLTGGGATTYTWSGGASNNVPFAPPSTATYVVTGLTGNCTGTAAVAITVNTAPAVTANTTASLVCSGSSVTLNGGGASTYTWSGSVTDGTPFAPSGTAVYTVTGTGSNGCTATATVNVTVSLCTGLANNSNNSDLLLYPNPNNGVFTIETKDFSSASIVQIYDNLGKLILNEKINGSKHIINTTMAVGIYTLKIIDHNTVQSVHKLIVE